MGNASLQSNSTVLKILRLLAAGGWCSGEELGRVLGISRAAVSKQIKQLGGFDLQIESAKGRGYRLERPLDLLSEEALLAFIDESRGKNIGAVHLFPNVGSTNAYLLDHIRQDVDCHGHICLAEQQSAGRGRRGRVWHSPFAQNIYLSIVWSFSGGVSALEGLSLAVGVAVARVLKRVGVGGFGLKWPNDILVGDRKLGGVLIELAGDLSGECFAVVGVGLNVNMLSVSETVDQPWVSLQSLGYSVGRNELSGRLVNELLGMLSDYEQKGFTYYQEEWNGLNAHQGRQVALISGKSKIVGDMLGVDTGGAVMLAVDGESRSFVGGELSLRLES